MEELGIPKKDFLRLMWVDLVATCDQNDTKRCRKCKKQEFNHYALCRICIFIENMRKEKSELIDAIIDYLEHRAPDFLEKAGEAWGKIEMESFPLIKLMGGSAKVNRRALLNFLECPSCEKARMKFRKGEVYYSFVCPDCKHEIYAGVPSEFEQK